MELWTADFWLVVTAASTFATVLATILSLAVSAWWRKLDSLEADWAPHTARPSWEPPYREGEPSVPSVEFTLANAGDGTAFRTELRGDYCTVTMGGYSKGQLGTFRAPTPMLPAMHPGDDVQVWVECDPRLWDVASVMITWRRSPTWRKKHSQRTATIPLTEIAERPVYGTDKIDDTTGNYVRKPLPEPDQPPLTADQTAALAGHRRRRLPWRRD